jgi:hypothetical protein
MMIFNLKMNSIIQQQYQILLQNQVVPVEDKVKQYINLLPTMN